MKRSREAGCSSQKTSYGNQSQVHGNENTYPHERQASEQYLKAVEEVCYDRLDELRKLLLEFMNERNQLDVLVENLKSTRTCVDNLLNQLKKEPDNPICIKDHFSALHLRCIAYIYGEHGLDVIEVIHSNDAARALPIVQKRLIQKQEEWSTYRDEYFHRVWM